jgi:hypothetical protein
MQRQGVSQVRGQPGLHSETPSWKKKNVGKDMEKREQLYTDANVDWYSHYGKQHGVSSKILKKKKKKLPHDWKTSSYVFKNIEIRI